jgi:hypothetical protein
MTPALPAPNIPSLLPIDPYVVGSSELVPAVARILVPASPDQPFLVLGSKFNNSSTRSCQELEWDDDVPDLGNSRVPYSNTDWFNLGGSGTCPGFGFADAAGGSKSGRRGFEAVLRIMF